MWQSCLTLSVAYLLRSYLPSIIFWRGNFHWRSVRRVWNYIWESCVTCTKKWSPTSSLALYLMLAFYVACCVFQNASFWVFHLPCLVFHLASLSEICCRNLLGIYSDTPFGISSGSFFFCFPYPTHGSCFRHSTWHQLPDMKSALKYILCSILSTILSGISTRHI